MFKFSVRSRRALEGVHGDLQAWANRLIQITPVDFVVLQGLRTPAQQAELVRTGASQTMNSRHLTGHAVDLGAWVSTIRWELSLYCDIAEAAREACLDVGVPIRWGGCWMRLDITTEPPDYMVATYVESRHRRGLRAFVDAGHFELPATRYP